MSPAASPAAWGTFRGAGAERRLRCLYVRAETPPPTRVAATLRRSAAGNLSRWHSSIGPDHLDQQVAEVKQNQAHDKNQPALEDVIEALRFFGIPILHH